jgi:hypothetical protein
MGWVQSILWGETRRVRDARGAWRELFDPASRSQISSNRLSAELMASVRRRALLLTLASRRRAGLGDRFWGNFALAQGLVVVSLSFFVPLGVHRIVPYAIAFGITALVVWLLYRFSNFADPHQTARVYLSRARCPACGYDLAEITPDEQGRKTCPECGACWAKRRR